MLDANMRTWTDEARDHARTILTRMLLAVNPQTLLRKRASFDGERLHLFDGQSVEIPRGRTRLLAIGKAAGGMAAAAQAWTPARLGADGPAGSSSAAHAQPWGPFVEAVCIAPHDAGIPEFECLASDHPEPTARSVAAGERALQVARATGPDDTLLVLLSGGASALAEVPAGDLDELKRVTRLLQQSGATIHELNVVRRHLSRLKGGGLLRAARGRVVTLAISDVAGDAMHDVGSGPSSPDPTTIDDARAVLGRYGLTDAFPRLPWVETLKPADVAPARVASCILARNVDALDEGARIAAALGYRAETRPEWLAGEARERGRDLATIARTLPPRSCLLVGGETTVRVVGGGKGGRNQEVALAAVDGLSARDAVLATMGTDGVDGPTDAAGAIVDGRTRGRAMALGLDAEHHLHENDSYAYFEALDDLVRTGPTGTNVRDVAVLLT